MKRRKKRLALVFILVVVVLYISVLLVDYVNMLNLAKRPMFAIEANKEHSATCYDYKYEGLGYNFYTSECYNPDNSQYEMKYVKYTIFDKEIRQGVYGITLERNI